MKKDRSHAPPIKPHILRDITVIALNLLLILGPIASALPEVRAEIASPQQTAGIDAAFYHPGEKASYFFQGDRYYRLTETKVDQGYPKKLPGDFIGLPEHFHSAIDAAVVDPASGNIYLFKGNKYAAIKADTKTVFPGYGNVTLPGGWRGLPAEFTSGLDAAIEEDGAVVFIKGNRRAIVKYEAFVRAENFSASALTGAGVVNAAFKYSNGRNYFFSGDMFSRAIGFVKEANQLNPITSTWIGINASPTTNVVTGDLVCSEGTVNPPGDRSACVKQVFFHPAAGISFDAAQNTAIQNGWVLASVDEMNTAVARLELSAGGRSGMINDGRLAIPVQTPSTGLTRGPNIGYKGSHQGFFYVLKQVAGREQAAPPPPEWSEDILNNSVYDLRRYELLCTAQPINPMLDGWRTGDPMIEEAGRLLLQKEGRTVDSGALRRLAAELRGDPVRRWQFAPFMLRVMWDAISAADPIPIQKQFKRRFEQWAACDETNVARLTLAQWSRHIKKYGISLPTGQQYCEEVPLQGGGTAERCVPSPTVYEIPPEIRYKMNTLGLVLDTKGSRGSIEGFLPLKNPMELGTRGRVAIASLYKPLLAHSSADFDDRENLAPLGPEILGLLSALNISEDAVPLFVPLVGAETIEMNTDLASAINTNDLATRRELVKQLLYMDKLLDAELGAQTSTAQGLDPKVTATLEFLRDKGIETILLGNSVTDNFIEAIAGQVVEKVAQLIFSKWGPQLTKVATRLGMNTAGFTIKEVATKLASNLMVAVAVAGVIYQAVEILVKVIGDAVKTDQYDQAINDAARTVRRYETAKALGPGTGDLGKVTVLNKLAKMTIAEPADRGALVLAYPAVPCPTGYKPAFRRQCIQEVKFYQQNSISLEQAKAMAARNGWLVATQGDVAEAWVLLGLDVYAFGMTADGSFSVPVQRDFPNFEKGPNIGVSGGNQGFFYTEGVPKGTAYAPGAAWNRTSGTMKHVSVGSDGTKWALDSADRIYRWNGTGWMNMPGGLRQISVGDANNVWGVNGDDRIFRWNGRSWDLIAGGLKHVSVGSDGTVWGVNGYDQVWRWNGTGWILDASQKLKQIAVGDAGKVWGVNAANEVFRWNGKIWKRVPGSLKYVSVGADGSVWGVDSNDLIYVWNGKYWTNISGRLKQISVGDSRRVIGTNVNNEVYERRF